MKKIAALLMALALTACPPDDDVFGCKMACDDDPARGQDPADCRRLCEKGGEVTP
jgi:hypothetical protein